MHKVLLLLCTKPDGPFVMCNNYRKVNTVTKTDSFSVPREDYLIDNISHAKYVTKFDKLRRFWHIPLTERAKDIPVFLPLMGCMSTKLCHLK